MYVPHSPFCCDLRPPGKITNWWSLALGDVRSHAWEHKKTNRMTLPFHLGLYASNVHVNKWSDAELVSWFAVAVLWGYSRWDTKLTQEAWDLFLLLPTVWSQVIEHVFTWFSDLFAGNNAHHRKTDYAAYFHVLCVFIHCSNSCYCQWFTPVE